MSYVRLDCVIKIDDEEMIVNNECSIEWVKQFVSDCLDKGVTIIRLSTKPIEHP